MARAARLFFFLCAMGLVGVFFHADSVFAHDEGEMETLTPASEVRPEDEGSVRDFVERAAERFRERGLRPFRQESRIEGGPWKHESTYIILTVRDAAWIHGFYPEAEDRDLSSQVPEGLLRPGAAGPKCVKYDDPDGAAERHACAVAVEIIRGQQTTSAVLIGGFHHGSLPEEPFDDLLGSGYVPDVKASDVVDAETLRLFVEDAIEAFQRNFGLSRAQAPFPGGFRPVLRREGGHWNHGDIYLFIMQGNAVFFNGNDQALEDTTLNITDLKGCNVGDEIMRIVAGEDRECQELGLLPPDSEGFLEYLWDNPDIEGDEDRRFDDPAFGQRVAPGITPKLGYVRSIRLQTTGRNLIVGAGVYPAGDTGGGDGDGCAVAGSGDTRKSALLNLLLVGLALLAAASRNNRRGDGGQWGRT